MFLFPSRRRTLAWAAAILCLAPTYAAAQKKDDKNDKKQQEMLRQETQALIKLVDAAAAGQPAASDFSIQWHNDFLKAQEGLIYVPFTLTLDPAKLTSCVASMYIRAASRSSSDASSGTSNLAAFQDVHFLDLKPSVPDGVAIGEYKTRQGRERDSALVEGLVSNKAPNPARCVWVTVKALGGDGKPIAAASTLVSPAVVGGGASGQYAVTLPKAKDAGKFDVSIENLTGDSVREALRISRALSVPAGDYDVFIAIRERNLGSAGGQPLKMAVLKQPVTVPDYWDGELTTSTLILADRAEQRSAPPDPADQAAHPYTLGLIEITPAADARFGKQEELLVFLQVYNAGMTPDGKPNLEVEYNFHQKTADGEKYFNRTPPQQLNAQTLPHFDAKAGHQLTAAQGIPLAIFPEGDYRLEIKVTDKISGKSVKREAMFTVVGT